MPYGAPATPTLPNAPSDARSQWVVAAGARYWPAESDALVASLALPEVSWQPSGRCVLVSLPDWAADLGVGTPAALLVDSSSIAPGEGGEFSRCNWLAAAFLFLSGAQERQEHVSSYAAFLTEVDPRLFERAWVNRIFLLVRRLTARQAGTSETTLFGPLPRAVFDVTHDVDAVRKTPEIRLKQSAFRLFNAGRAAASGNWRHALQQTKSSVRFAVSNPDYWTFGRLRAIEKERGVRSTFHVYAGPAGLRRMTPSRVLLDPAYDVQNDKFRRELATLLEGGWSIGLHPSFHSWSDPETIAREKSALERASGAPVTRCRQHWLRFSWRKTWQAQIEAGLKLDSTLGFNDRPGLRNGAALRFSPWSFEHGRTLPIQVLPMLFMDSHFYDYNPLDAPQRRQSMTYWINEVRAVGGEASVNWHSQTLADDYGWGDGYVELLELLSETGQS